MNAHKIKVVALDLDGTLTQHKTPLSPENKHALLALAQKYRLIMVGAGQCRRIFNQLGHFPIDIIGNYGLQYAHYDPQTGDIHILRDLVIEGDCAAVEEKASAFRQKHGLTHFAGDSVEYHPSGCLTLALLGTQAAQDAKLSFDPDRTKRRAMYAEVCATFPDYHVFVGGSSSFDMAPKPYNKYYALDLFCRENGYKHDEIVFIGDDYGYGGNDESVFLSDISFICVDDYRTFPQKIQPLL